jgi:outer membrane protein, heavy metal efflux system
MERGGYGRCEPMTTGTRPAALAALFAATLAACVAVPPPAPLRPADTGAEFGARRLAALPDLPPAASGWSRSQWLAAALELNPQLAERRADVAAAAAAERTAAERPNPGMELFAEYLRDAAESASWLYGVSLDFLLRQPGARARARERAQLETALAQSDLTDSIWQVRAALRQALLDAVSSHDETRLLESLVAQRQALLQGDRRRVELGDLDRTQLLADQLELARAQQRRQQSQARGQAAEARLAAAVGVPAAALGAVPLRWDDWTAIDALSDSAPARWRDAALIGRPQIVRALREYDLAELALRNTAAQRWPQLRITPAYAWGPGGARSDTLEDIAQESAVGVSFELPVFNQHQGPIGEAVARRAAAGEHLKAVQADIFAQIDGAERAWPAARAAWDAAREAADLAADQKTRAERALSAGDGDRSAALTAQIGATEAQLAVLDAAYAAQEAFALLEDAYRRPLEGAEGELPHGAGRSS